MPVQGSTFNVQGTHGVLDGAGTAVGASSFHTDIVDPIRDPRWGAFVASHPGALVYHHPAWIHALMSEYERPHPGLLCADANGTVRGVLPLVRTRGVPLIGKSFMSGPRLASLPRTPVAGPLALDDAATAALLRAAVDRARQDEGVTLQIKAWSGEPDRLVPELTRVPWRQTFVFSLPARPEDVRFGNSRHHARVKWCVNKAAQAGVRVREAESERELRAWYRLYLETMRLNVVPPRPYRFFRACWNALRPLGMMRLLLAELDPESPSPRVEEMLPPRASHTDLRPGSKPLIAGCIFFPYRYAVFYAFGAMSRRHAGLHANDALHWYMIHQMCREGFRYYDFGEVPDGNPGLMQFKAKWGADARRLYRYQYPADPAAGNGLDRAASRPRRVAEAAWQYLPLAVTAALGNGIYGLL